MIVIDTHAWIWWASAPEKLGVEARRALVEATSIGVSAISCWEVVMLAQRSRLKLDRPVREWLQQAVALERVRLLPLSVDVAVESGDLEASLPGDPADRLIVATARVHQAPLVTRDARLQRSGQVEVIW